MTGGEPDRKNGAFREWSVTGEAGMWPLSQWRNPRDFRKETRSWKKQFA